MALEQWPTDRGSMCGYWPENISGEVILTTYRTVGRVGREEGEPAAMAEEQRTCAGKLDLAGGGCDADAPLCRS